jgi:hypothetical protein
MGVCENFLGRYLLSGTRYKRYASFPDEFVFPAPLNSVTSIKYYDESNALQTLSASYYALDATNEEKVCQFVGLAYGYTWPSAYQKNDAVIVEYVSGWTDSTLIPQPIKSGILLAIESLFDGDDGGGFATAIGVKMKTAELLWWPYRWVPC